MNAFRPVHAQIKDYLLSKIREGAYGPGDRLPTEDELTRQFQTSKSPVRQALENLRMEGVIYRHPGRGTFVSPSPTSDGAWTLGSIKDIIGFGAHTRFHLLDFSRGKISKELHRIFKVEKGKFIHIQGIRFLRDRPLYYLSVFLPQHIGRSIKVKDIAETPIILALEKKLRIRLNKCIQNISAASADARLAKSLEIPPGSPVLCIERFYYSEPGEIIEWARSYCRPDLFKHRSILSRG
jgi:GntR family transcriptional regulator